MSDGAAKPVVVNRPSMVSQPLPACSMMAHPLRTAGRMPQRVVAAGPAAALDASMARMPRPATPAGAAVVRGAAPVMRVQRATPVLGRRRLGRIHREWRRLGRQGRGRAGRLLLGGAGWWRKALVGGRLRSRLQRRVGHGLLRGQRGGGQRNHRGYATEQDSAHHSSPSLPGRGLREPSKRIARAERPDTRRRLTFSRSDARPVLSRRAGAPA